MTKSQAVYCRHIADRIEQIERFTRDGEQKFMEDDLIQEGVIRCFEVIGEAVKRLETDTTNTYPDVSWRGFAGFRDILIHQYDDIDIEKVWEVVQDDLPPLKVAINSLLESLDTDDENIQE